MTKIDELNELIKNSKRIAILTGAGISVPSGIPDFRSDKGLYNEENQYHISPEEIISHSFFMKHPKAFFTFYKSKMLYPNVKPNSAHQYLASLDKDHDVTIITQNIDGLHQKAGSKNVIELHGSVLRNYCMKCKKFYSVEEIIKQKEPPICNCGGIIKPDVVLYEENLDYPNLVNATRAISNASLLIIIGTSLVVNPAASLINYFNHSYGKIVLINKTKTPYDNIVDLVFYDDVIKVFQSLKAF